MNREPHRPITGKIVIATHNAGKLREMREILAPWRVDVRALSDFTRNAADETGLTFVENALLKARFAAHAAGEVVSLRFALRLDLRTLFFLAALLVGLGLGLLLCLDARLVGGIGSG